MKRVLITDAVAEAGLSILRARGLEVVDLVGAPIADLLKVIGGVHGWIIRSGTQIDSELLIQADHLQVIGRAGVGVDNIDIQTATLRGVLVMNTPDGNTISAAEHTIALLMALARNVHLGHASLSVGQWDRKALKGVELNGKTLGIIGLGRIGQRVMKYALGLDMQVVGFDPYAPKSLQESDSIDLVDLDTLLKRADFLTVHVPKNDDTVDLINLERMRQLKSTARIINVARGGIVNEADLATALNNDIIAGAAVDVFSQEPPPDDLPLLHAKNLLLTPHLGASTREAQEGVSLAICEQVADFLVDEKLSNALNFPISDMALLKKLEPYLDLAGKMGRMLQQLLDHPVESVCVTCFGAIEDANPVSLAALKGILEPILDTRLNFVNISAVASERGIDFSQTVDTTESGYANLIEIRVTGGNQTVSMSGSVFGGRHARVVEIDGFHLELKPEENMLFIRNHDTPGVLGSIGTTLGGEGINIGECLLSREQTQERAYLVIKVDTPPPPASLEALMKLENIISVRKVTL